MQNSSPQESRRVVRLYYGFQFSFSLLLWLPVFYEVQKRLGLSDPEVFGIQSYYYLIFCLLEIPTGMTADLFGYRRCLIAGAVAIVLSSAIPLGVPTYGGFFAHFMLVALARSLISGASSAYLYEYLRLKGSPVEYRRIEGNARAYGLFGKVVLWSAMGFVARKSLMLPYWATLLATLPSIYFAVALPELPNAGGGFKKYLGELGPLFRHLGRAPRLPMLMLQGLAIFVLTRICQVNLFQPILAWKGLSVASFGLVMSAMTLSEALGSTRPALLRSRLSDQNAVFFLTAIMAVCLGLLSQAGQAASVIALCVFALAGGVAFPLQKQLLNDAITDSRFRATLLSVESIIDRAVCAAVAWVLARYLAGPDGLGTFLTHSAGVTLALMAALFVILKKFRQ